MDTLCDDLIQLIENHSNAFECVSLLYNDNKTTTFDYRIDYKWLLVLYQKCWYGLGRYKNLIKTMLEQHDYIGLDWVCASLEKSKHDPNLIVEIYIEYKLNNIARDLILNNKKLITQSMLFAYHYDNFEMFVWLYEYSNGKIKRWYNPNKYIYNINIAEYITNKSGRVTPYQNMLKHGKDSLHRYLYTMQDVRREIYNCMKVNNIEVAHKLFRIFIDDTQDFGDCILRLFDDLGLGVEINTIIEILLGDCIQVNSTFTDILITMSIKRNNMIAVRTLLCYSMKHNYANWIDRILRAFPALIKDQDIKKILYDNIMDIGSVLVYLKYDKSITLSPKLIYF